MTIESTLERLATATEALAASASANTTLLEALLSRLNAAGQAEAAAGQAIEKAATRGRIKKTSAEEAAPSTTTSTEVAHVAAETSATTSPTAETAPVPAETKPAVTGEPPPPIEAIQEKAASVAALKGKERVVALIKGTGATKLSEVPAEKRAELYRNLVALETEAVVADEFQ